MYQKLRSYDVCFLRYRVQQTEFFVILGHFLLFYHTNNAKIKILKIRRKKKCLEISSLYTSVPKIMILCYTVHEIWRMTYVIVIFHFGLFFALLPPPPKKSKFKKWKKHMGIKNYDLWKYSSWDIVHDRWTDRQTDWKSDT